MPGLARPEAALQNDRAAWPALRAPFEARFAEHTRAERCARLEHLDACFSPVLTLAESAAHAHHARRGPYCVVDGVVQTSSSPRFDRTPAPPAGPVPVDKTGADAVLNAWSHP